MSFATYKNQLISKVMALGYTNFVNTKTHTMLYHISASLPLSSQMRLDDTSGESDDINRYLSGQATGISIFLEKDNISKLSRIFVETYIFKYQNEDVLSFEFYME